MSEFSLSSGNPSGHVCGLCNSVFQSRNKLFKHLPICKSIKDGTSIPSSEENTNISSTIEKFDFHSYNAYIYVTGGRIRGKTLGSVERYNIETKIWETCPPMIENRGSHCVVTIGSPSVSHYVSNPSPITPTCSSNTHSTTLSSLESSTLNQSNNSPSNPCMHSSLSPSHLYILGGGGFHSNLSTCEAYNPLTNQYSPISPMNTARHALSACTLSHYVYAIGGWENGSTCVNTVECYDILSDRWSFRSPMKTARRLLGVTVYENKIYAFGGNRNDPEWYTAIAEVYDTETDSWSSLSNMPLKGESSAITVNNRIFIFVHGQSVLEYIPSTDKYRPISQLPLPEWFNFSLSLSPFQDIIYIIGGASQGRWCKDVYSFNTSTSTWTAIESMQNARRRSAACLLVIPRERERERE
mmetsp:Transcript_15989/g.16114  ORF Transcript_15989/g.16114 Transcript_15989/m.16114 type:complete len:412 (+) Transcript_15989:90-1325(+)